MNLLLVKGDSLIVLETKILVKESKQTMLPLSIPHNASPFARTSFRGKKRLKNMQAAQSPLRLPVNKLIISIRRGPLIPQRSSLI